MKNQKLNLNKATIANLTSTDMLNTQGGRGGPAISSKRNCCGSAADIPADISSDRKCCECAAEIGNLGLAG